MPLFCEGYNAALTRGGFGPKVVVTLADLGAELAAGVRRFDDEGGGDVWHAKHTREQSKCGKTKQSEKKRG